MPNNQNLRPFNTLPPQELKEISRKGGIASGERRRGIAEIKDSVRTYSAAYDLIEETREEYRAAIKRYAKEERKKAARRAGSVREKKAYDLDVFPQRLRDLRRRRRISGRAVAELCGLSQSAVYRYENGERLPSIEAAAQLADFFDVSIDFLCGRE